MEFFKKNWWRSSYKLPLSFIVFFVLIFFLLGEQLPALPTYLLGLGSGEGGPSKLHILDLAMGDGLHRPFAYFIIGIVIWVLYRIFTWPLAWFMGAVLWVLEQQTLTPLDQRTTLISTVVFTATFWVILTLVPYFVYRWVDKRWGSRGKRNTILVTLAINLLLVGFFAYQIYILHNSYRSLGSGPAVPAYTCPERLVIEKDKQTTGYWDGEILPVSGEVQNWVEANCPRSLEQSWSNFKNGHFGDSQNQEKKNEEKIENRESNQWGTSKVTEVYDNSHVKLPPCEGNALLTTSPMDIDKIPAISPIGDAHVWPSDHGGIIYPGAGPTDWGLKLYVAETEIHAPADGHIFKIEKTTYQTNGKVTKQDYDIAFSPCREFVVYMSHVSAISGTLQNFLDSLPDPSCNIQSEPSQTYTFCNYSQIDYKTRSGEVIGSVKSNGTDVMGMDFGSFDTRTPALPFLGAWYGDSRKLQTLHTTCPYDYYAPPLKEQLYGKLRQKTEPRCGVAMQDKDNTIQGNWQVKDYQPQANDAGDWAKPLAVVHYYGVDPEIGEIRVGGVVAPPGTLGFNPTHVGTINREPSEVTADGSIYCFEEGQSGVPRSSIHSGRMLIQLIDRLTLKVEFQAGRCGGNLNFSSPTIYER